LFVVLVTPDQALPSREARTRPRTAPPSTPRSRLVTAEWWADGDDLGYRCRRLRRRLAAAEACRVVFSQDTVATLRASDDVEKAELADIIEHVIANQTGAGRPAGTTT
jgi:hypothetical protein